ncbi:MAG TPA: cytochrome b [Rhodoblastus sp.]|nr:cytochrome b [Rhodoblastus sp.]
MPETTEKTKYATPVIVLHWLMALLILSLYAVGLSIDSFDKPLRPPIVNLHAIFGLTVLALLVLRVAARSTSVAPPFPPSMGSLFQRAAVAGHGLLYLLMAAVPLVGVPTFLFRGRPLDFGLFQIPSPLEANRDLAHQFGEVHELLAHLLIATVAAHVLIALYHQFILRDGILARIKR